MSRKTTLSAIGGYQSFLFCIGMYFVALFFSIFICSAIFYAVNPRTSVAKEESAKPNTAMVSGGSKQILLTVTK